MSLFPWIGGGGRGWPLALILLGLAGEPHSLSADISLGGANPGGTRERHGLGQTGYSDLSNREYENRQESIALDKARRLKDAMRQVTGSLPALPGAEAKREPVTGVSDGSWYEERLRRIQAARGEEMPKEHQGFMDRIGETLDDWATKSVKEGRPWEVEAKEGFRPLEGIGKLADRVGESAQDLVTLPKLELDRNAAEGGRPERATEPRVVERPVEVRPVAETRPEVGRGTGEAPKEAGRASPSASREVVREQDGEGWMERVKAVARRSGEEPPRRQEEEQGGRTAPSSIAQVGSGSSPQSRPGKPGEERFELEDVVPGGSGGGGGRMKGLLGNRPASSGGAVEGSAILDRIKDAGQRGAASRPAVALPEAEGPLAADPGLYVVRVTEAEFYPFEDESSTAVTLQGGSLVRMAKPGEEWSGVETVGAGKGIIRTDLIRRAREAEVAVGAVPAKTVAAKKPVPSLGDALPLEIRPRVTPEPARGESATLGAGLLPPLLPDP